MSIIQDPFTYEKFEKVVLGVHGVRTVSELAITTSSRTCPTTNCWAS